MVCRSSRIVDQAQESGENRAYHVVCNYAKTSWEKGQRSEINTT